MSYAPPPRTMETDYKEVVIDGVPGVWQPLKGANVKKPEDAFIELMNGCEIRITDIETTFVTPCGDFAIVIKEIPFSDFALISCSENFLKNIGIVNERHAIESFLKKMMKRYFGIHKLTLSYGNI